MKRRGLRVCRRSLTNLVIGAHGGLVLGYRKRANCGLSFADTMVEEVVKNIFKVAAKQQAGKFKPQREKDVLTVALGNLECNITTQFTRDQL